MAVISPLSITEAKLFVGRHHRHHRAPQGGLFAIGLSDEDSVVGAAIVSRPVARMLYDGYTAEVIRLCVLDDIPNGCSQLYSACWRAARAMGYHKLITYVLDTEPGTSLKAAGWKVVGKTQGGSWSRDGRPRVDKHPLQGKFRWEVTDG